MNYYNEFDKRAAEWLRGRMGLLRGAGNAIVPDVAAEFLAAYSDIRGI